MAEAPSLYTHVPEEEKPFISYRVIECREPGVQTVEEWRCSRKWKGLERTLPLRLMGAKEEQARCGLTDRGLQWQPRGFSCLISQWQLWQELPILRAHFPPSAVALQVQLAGKSTASPAALLEKLGPVLLPLCPRRKQGLMNSSTRNLWIWWRTRNQPSEQHPGNPGNRNLFLISLSTLSCHSIPLSIHHYLFYSHFPTRSICTL